MENASVFKCEYGTVIARGTVDRKLLEAGCRKAFLMNERAKNTKAKEKENAA